MRIWLEKGQTSYYVFDVEPAWSAVREYWELANGAGGQELCATGVETFFPWANEMRIGDLAEIELTNVGVWLPLSDTTDERINPSDYNGPAQWYLIPGRFVENYNDEE